MNIRTENWNGNQIRFIEKEPGDWWAVAGDVAEALGYKLTTNMTRLIDKKDKGVHKVNTLGGDQSLLIISEFAIYDATFNSKKREAKEFKRWVFAMLKELRQSSGLEGFQVFRFLDKEHQKEAMSRLKKGLTKPAQADFMKANTIADKAVSNLFGYSKMLKKHEMTPDMIRRRQPILDDTVSLMEAKQKFKMNLSVSQMVYGKYLA